MGQVIAGEERGVHEFPELAGRRRDLHVERVVARLRRREVVSLAAHAADPRRDARHLFDGPAHTERLETAQFRDDEEAVRYLAVIIDSQDPEEIDRILDGIVDPVDSFYRFSMGRATLGRVATSGSAPEPRPREVRA
jgi:hypothetical protein